MALKNPWVGYVERTYQQIKSSVLTKYQALIPEMKDHTESNIFVKMLSVWAGLTEHLNYYLDNKAREVFLSVARRFESAVKIAKLFDYRIRGTVASTADQKFYLDVPAPSDILIPQGTEVKTKEGISFITTEDGTILATQSDVVIPIKQWTKKINVVLGTSTGLKDQVFELEANVVDGSISIVIGIENYTPQETLAYSISTSQHFVASVVENKKMAVKFGDDVNGKIPPIGSSIVATYYISNGEAGNIGINAITEIPITIPSLPGGITVKTINENRASGGVDQEGLEVLRKRIPRSIRTLYRAVTPKDYQDIAEIANGVAKAGVLFNCGKTVDVYVVPEGGGVASSGLLSDVEDFFDDKRMITTRVNAIAAGELRLKFQIDITAFPNFVNDTVKQTVSDNLVAFGGPTFQEIKGSVVLSDIYEVIETSEGVKNSNVKVMTPIPFARKLAGSHALTWTPEVLPASDATHKWKIIIISSTILSLFKDDSFVGNFAIGLTIQTEVQFTITGTYTAGDAWEFYTYKYFGTIDLTEMSIPAIYASDLVLNVGGGI